MNAGRDWRSTPSRPSVSPALVCALAFWASCAWAYSSARTLSQSSCSQIAAGSLCACAIVLLGMAKARHAHAPAVLAALLLGVFVASMQSASMHEANGALYDSAMTEIEFEVVEDSAPSRYGMRCTASARYEAGRELIVAVMTDPDDRLYYGERFKAKMALKPADFSSDEYSWNKGVVATGKPVGRSEPDSAAPLAKLAGARRKVIERIGASDTESALVSALVCGYRADMKETGVYGQFQTCGLAHMIAVSGAHLVIVTSFVVAVLKRARVPRRISIALSIGFMASYVVMSGAPVSVIRASLMSSVGLLALVGRRRPSSENALGIVVFAVVGTDPHVALSTSFALSTLSTLGIVLFAPLAGYAMERLPLRLPAAIVEPVSLTVSASVLSMGVSCSTFGQLALIAPFTNLLCAPLFPLACGTGMLAAVSIAFGLPFAGVVLAVARAASGMLIGMVGLLAQVPYACVPVYVSHAQAFAATLAFAFFLWLAWDGLVRARTAWVAFALPVLVVAGSFAAPVPDSVVMLNVGQGDAFLVRSCGASLLVDTGNQDAMLLRSLGRHRVAHIDSVLLTHADDDHCGSLDALDRAVDVDRVIMSEGMRVSRDEKCVSVVGQSNECAGEVRGVAFHDSFEVGRFSVKVVWPRDGKAGENEDSVCLLASYDGDGDGEEDASMLFTGDAESEQLEAMAKAGDLREVDILKVGHHGSKESLAQNLLELLKPKIALIGVGENNRYGHPARETVDLLERCGVAVYRTDIDGDVSCIMAPKGVKVVVEG